MQEAEDLIVAERLKWGWGSKKILVRLASRYPDLELPARSTADAILSRHGLVKHGRRQRPRSPAAFARRYNAVEPGELTTIDHKGQFRMLNGKYCYPLTIVDFVSRYILACEALDSTSFERAWPVIDRVFREHGLPRAMQSDNGPPFGAPHGKFSRLTVELMSLDVQPVFGRPGVPQDNGRHERMHRDLGNYSALHPARTFAEQQVNFRSYIRDFNFERPHEGLGMKTPASVYTGSSSRPYPRRKRAPEYADHWEKRVVGRGGEIKWHQRNIFIGHALAGQTIAFELTNVELWTVRFHRFDIGKLDEKNDRFI
jgi:putative transposase